MEAESVDCTKNNTSRKYLRVPPPPFVSFSLSRFFFFGGGGGLLSLSRFVLFVFRGVLFVVFRIFFSVVVGGGLRIEVVPLVFAVWLLHSTWKGGQASLVIIHPLNLSRAGSKRHTPGPRLSRRAKPREGAMLTRHHCANNLHDAGYWPRRMKFSQELNGYVFKTKASHLDGGPAVVWHGEG